MELEKGRHTVYTLSYHAVFVVKYRRNVITPEMTEYMRGLIETMLLRQEGKLLEMESDGDHIHLLFTLPPTVAPSSVVNTLKTITSRELRRRYQDEIRQYLWKDTFWKTGYFISTTGGASIEQIRQYIQSQQTEEHHKKRGRPPKMQT